MNGGDTSLQHLPMDEKQCDMLMSEADRTEQQCKKVLENFLSKKLVNSLHKEAIEELQNKLQVMKDVDSSDVFRRILNHSFLYCFILISKNSIFSNHDDSSILALISLLSFILKQDNHHLEVAPTLMASPLIFMSCHNLILYFVARKKKSHQTVNAIHEDDKDMERVFDDLHFIFEKFMDSNGILRNNFLVYSIQSLHTTLKALLKGFQITLTFLKQVQQKEKIIQSEKLYPNVIILCYYQLYNKLMVLLLKIVRQGKGWIDIFIDNILPLLFQLLNCLENISNVNFQHDNQEYSNSYDLPCKKMKEDITRLISKLFEESMKNIAGMDKTLQYITFLKSDANSKADNLDTDEQSLTKLLDIEQQEYNIPLKKQSFFVRGNRTNVLSRIFSNLLQIIGEMPRTFILHINSFGKQFSHHFFFQLYHVASTSFRKYQFDFSIYLELIYSIFKSLLTDSNYPLLAEQSNEFLILKDLYMTMLKYLDYKATNDEEVRLIFKNIAILTRLDPRYVTKHLPYIWVNLFNSGYDILSSQEMDFFFATLFEVYAAARRSEELLESYFSAWDNLNAQNLLDCKTTIHFIQSKTLRRSFSELINSLPDGQISSFFEMLILKTEERIQHFDQNSNPDIFTKELSILLLPFILFSYSIPINGNFVSFLRENANTTLTKIVQPLIQISLSIISKYNDNAFTQVLQLYYGMCSVIQRAIEYVSDIFDYKPINSSLKEDHVIQFDEMNGITLSHLQKYIPNLSFQSKGILCYIIIQRMYKIKQQKLLQTYNFIHHVDTSEREREFSFLTHNFDLYLSFLHNEFNENLLNIPQCTKQLLSDQWDGSIERVDTKQQYAIALWNLLLDNFSNILDFTKHKQCNQIVDLAIDIEISERYSQPSKTDQESENAIENEILHYERGNISDSPERNLNMIAITHKFWNDPDIISNICVIDMIGTLLHKRLLRYLSTLMKDTLGYESSKTLKILDKFLIEDVKLSKCQKYLRKLHSKILSPEGKEYITIMDETMMISACQNICSHFLFLLKLPASIFPETQRLLFLNMINLFDIALGAIFQLITSRNSAIKLNNNILFGLVCEWISTTRKCLLHFFPSDMQIYENESSLCSLMAAEYIHQYIKLHEFCDNLEQKQKLRIQEIADKTLHTSMAYLHNMLCQCLLTQEAYNRILEIRRQLKQYYALIKTSDSEKPMDSISNSAEKSFFYMYATIYRSLIKIYQLSTVTSDQYKKKESNQLMKQVTEVPELFKFEMQFMSRYCFNKKSIEAANLICQCTHMVILATSIFSKTTIFASEKELSKLLIEALFEQLDEVISTIHTHARDVLELKLDLNEETSQILIQYLPILIDLTNISKTVTSARGESFKKKGDDITYAQVIYSLHEKIVKLIIDWISCLNQYQNQNMKFVIAREELLHCWDNLIEKNSAAPHRQYSTMKQMLEELKQSYGCIQFTPEMHFSKYDRKLIAKTMGLLECFEILCMKADKTLVIQFLDVIFIDLYNIFEAYAVLKKRREMMFKDPSYQEWIMNLFIKILQLLLEIVKITKKSVAGKNSIHFILSICHQISRSKLYTNVAQTTKMLTIVCELLISLLSMNVIQIYDHYMVKDITKHLLEYAVSKFLSHHETFAQNQREIMARNQSEEAINTPEKTDVDHILSFISSISRIFNAILYNPVMNSHYAKIVADFVIVIANNMKQSITDLSEGFHQQGIHLTVTHQGILEMLRRCEMNRATSEELSTAIKNTLNPLSRRILNELYDLAHKRKPSV